MVATIDDDPDIGLVSQHTVAFLRIAANGAVVPHAAPGARNAVVIEPRRDLPGRQSGSILFEDSTDDGGLPRLNLAVQVLVADNAIPIGHTGGDLTAPSSAELPTARLLTDLTRLNVGDTDVERHHFPVYPASICGLKLYALVLEPLCGRHDIRSTPTNTLDPLDEKSVDAAPLDMLLHPHHAWAVTQQSPAAYRLVGILADYVEPSALGSSAAMRQLIACGHLVLLFAAVARIEDGRRLPFLDFNTKAGCGWPTDLSVSLAHFTSSA